MQRFYLSLNRHQHAADPPRRVCATRRKTAVEFRVGFQVLVMWLVKE